MVSRRCLLATGSDERPTGQEAAIHRHYNSRDKVRSVRNQEGHRFGYVAWLSNPAERYHRQEALLVFGGNSMPLNLDQTWCDGVHADPVRSPFLRHATRERDHTSLGGAVVTGADARGKGSGRGQVDDRTTRPRFDA